MGKETAWESRILPLQYPLKGEKEKRERLKEEERKDKPIPKMGHRKEYGDEDPYE